MLRSPTFLVRSTEQRGTLEQFNRRDEHISTIQRAQNVALCFSAESFQRTHPAKARAGSKDADATLTAPMLLGVCDGVSQLEEFGMDPSELPHELLEACEELAMAQLMPEGQVSPADAYRGPISLLTAAYEATQSLGSTTVLLGALDNSTRIHGKLHPMIAVLSIGDCELLLLRRLNGPESEYEPVFHTEMQRIGGHVQTPLQLARVDDRIDEDFDEEVALEVIRKGSAVHCISAYEGDVVIMGSDGVFDNLFLDEVVDLVNNHLPPRIGSSAGFGQAFVPRPTQVLKVLAQSIVFDAHHKSGEDGKSKIAQSPIGMGGKIDDTSVVVAEVVPWTHAHSAAWKDLRRHKRLRGLLGCVGSGQCWAPCNADNEEDGYEEQNGVEYVETDEDMPESAAIMQAQQEYGYDEEDEYDEYDTRSHCQKGGRGSSKPKGPSIFGFRPFEWIMG